MCNTPVCQIRRFQWSYIKVLRIGFFAVVISFSWYVVDEVYGKTGIPLGSSNSPYEELGTPKLTVERIQLLQRIAAEERLSSNTQKDELAAIPALTQDRIELLRRIGGIENEDDISKVNSSAISGDTDNTIGTLSVDPIYTQPVNQPVNKGNPGRTNSEWESYKGIGQSSGAKEGFASSGWTTLSLDNWPDDIQAALIASCNDEGEKSLYVQMRTTYPGSETVRGRVGWDSSNPYRAPFTYDAGLNALRLRSGLEESFSMLKDGNKVTIQVPWHDSRLAAFEFSLKGSSQALKTAFDYCRSSNQTLEPIAGL